MVRFVDTDKRSSLCKLYYSSYYQNRVSRAQFLTREEEEKKKAICDFATHQFRTLAMVLMHAGGLDSFGINQKWQVSLYKG